MTLDVILPEPETEVFGTKTKKCFFRIRCLIS